MANLASILETLMIITFGASWPINLTKAWRARSTKGISILFYTLIFIGYLFGIVRLPPLALAPQHLPVQDNIVCRLENHLLHSFSAQFRQTVL